jgi:hypothetical protein
MVLKFIAFIVYQVHILMLHLKKKKKMMMNQQQRLQQQYWKHFLNDCMNRSLLFLVFYNLSNFMMPWRLAPEPPAALLSFY